MRLSSGELGVGARRFSRVPVERSSLRRAQSLQLDRVSGQAFAAVGTASKSEREMASSIASKPQICASQQHPYTRLCHELPRIVAINNCPSPGWTGGGTGSRSVASDPSTRPPQWMQWPQHLRQQPLTRVRRRRQQCRTRQAPSL